MVHQALYAMRQDVGIHFKDENYDTSIPTLASNSKPSAEQLTEIQERLFEPITQGENVLGVSPITGKTLPIS